MANKDIDSIGQSDKMLKATPQGDGEQQGEAQLAAILRFVSRLLCHYQLSVIITVEPDLPDPPTCLWCIFEPATPQFHPYCSLDCATASAIDDERNR